MIYWGMTGRVADKKSGIYSMLRKKQHNNEITKFYTSTGDE